MSSEVVSTMLSEKSGHTTMLDDQAYEPTYNEAFPPLAGGNRAGTPEKQANVPWSGARVKSSTVTQVFHVPVEERRFRDKNGGFGESEQARVANDIMSEIPGVAIEFNSPRDRSLTVVLTGKQDLVLRARGLIVKKLQTQAQDSMSIPKEHHRFILGPKGKSLTDLEKLTQTKISLPRVDEQSDEIKVVGTRQGIEQAKHAIQVKSDEQAKLGFERLTISKIYHPFIVGPNNESVDALMAKTGAKVNIPPLSVMKDDIIVSGEKEGVVEAVKTIMAMYNHQKTSCQTVSVEVRKKQHKYVIGPRGAVLGDILRATGVSVEVPPQEDPSETITLRGEQENLGPALSMVYSKANSVVSAQVAAPVWLHRLIIGKKGTNINKIAEQHPNVHFEFGTDRDLIELDGPPSDVQAAQVALEDIVKDLENRFSFVEININPKFHRHIIGKQGANVMRIKEETGVSIRIPPDSENSDVVRIEGEPAGVQQAKVELLEMAAKLENEKSKDVIIEQRFHRQLIGSQGASIKSIRDKFNEVQITFPEADRKSDIVTLRGPKNDVDKCARYLQNLQTELQASSFCAEVKIFKQFHKNVIGKGGGTIRNIRDETETRIDLPSETSDSEFITITGKKENVRKAKEKIEAIQKELANIVDSSIDIPHKHHNAVIGSKGRLIQQVMQECGGVQIRFPPEGSKQDKVTLRGPSEDVENAKKQLLDLSNDLVESGHTEELQAKPEYHRFLIGRRGDRIKKIREDTGARIIFPNQNDQDGDIIIIMGKKEEVAKGKSELEKAIRNLENITEMTISVPPKHHKHFVIRRGEVLRKIGEDYGGVSVSFPRAGVDSDVVVLKGPKECIEGAKERIEEIVENLEAQVTVECIIPQEYHRTIMGIRGKNVQDITVTHDVNIKFPDRANRSDNGEAPIVNGDANGHGCQDVIIINGRAENCQAAADALRAGIPITKDISVPASFHRFIIGQKGKDVRQMMNDYDVKISVPPSDTQSDVIQITGAASNVDKAIEGMNVRKDQLVAEQADRDLKSYRLVIAVDAVHHPKIIGKKGAIVSKIRDDHDVNIQFPERGGDKQDEIVVVGYEENAKAAERDIMSIVKELEDRTSVEVYIDNRIHSRLIGTRGRSIKTIMDEYKVDVRFPRQGDDPNLVVISGNEDDVLECQDHLLNLEEEYTQDLDERDQLNQYVLPTRQSGTEDAAKKNAVGYVVRDAPWSLDKEEFPGISSNSTTLPIAVTTWGPKRK